MRSLKDSIDEDGFVIVEDVLNHEAVSALCEVLAPIQKQAAQVSGGVRNLMALCASVRELAGSTMVRNLIEPVLGLSCFPVRAILFAFVPLQAARQFVGNKVNMNNPAVIARTSFRRSMQQQRPHQQNATSRHLTENGCAICLTAATTIVIDYGHESDAETQEGYRCGRVQG